MNKKKWMIKSVMTAVIATSVFAITIPAEAASSTILKKTVNTVKKGPIIQSGKIKSKNNLMSISNQKAAIKTKEASQYTASIKKEIESAAKALKDKKVELAADHLAKVDYFVKQAGKMGLSKSSKLIKDATSKLPQTLSEFNKKGTLYVASSSNATKPTVFGPAKGNQTINHTVFVYAGSNEHIKLTNLNVNANIIVKGTITGAGSVYFDHVKVNKVTVTGKGSKVSIFKAGVVNTLDIKTDSQINVNAGATVRAISLAAEKAGSKIELTGSMKDSVVTMANANAAVYITAGTSVGEMKKSPSVKGTIIIENKGTITKADSGMSFKGNQPMDNTIVNPTPVPAPTPVPGPTPVPVDPGKDNPPPVLIKPVLKSIEARFTAGTSVMDTQGTLTLTAVSNDQFFQGVVITSDQPNSVKLKITSLTAMGSDSNWLTAPREFILSNDKPITINELVGNATTGSEGVKMGTLRSFFMDKPITLMGTLLYTGPNGGESDPIVIKIYL